MTSQWTPALEKARLDLCGWLVDTARDDQSLGASVAARLREAEQCITVLADLANAPKIATVQGVTFENTHTSTGPHSPFECVACQREAFTTQANVIDRLSVGDCPPCFGLTRAGAIALCQIVVELRGGPRQ